MADDSKIPDKSRLPPKLDLKQRGVLGDPSGPVSPQPDASTEPTASPPDAPASDDTLGSTIRIDVEAAGEGGGTPGDEKPSTIRINIPASSTAPAAGSDASPDTKAKTVRVKRPDGLKRRAKTGLINPQPGKTSPIPLDKLAGELPASKTDQPKTIRLKRPTSSRAKPITKTAAPAERMPEPVAAATPESGVADAAPEEAVPQTPTRRKTIKVRRPDRGSRQARPMTIARGEAKGGAEGAAEAVAAQASLSGVPGLPTEPEKADGAVGVLVAVSGVAAVAVLGVLIYLLATQAFPGVNLSWPGRV